MTQPTPREIADRHFGEYRVKGDEIVPRYCPFCHGGEHRDAYTFAMNLRTGAYNCKRGSCGAEGSFGQLLNHFGERRQAPAMPQREKRAYKAPDVKPGEPAAYDTAAGRYLRSRGISAATWQRRRVFEYKGNIAFPYYENGKLVLVKYRPARPVNEGERKSWRSKDGKPVFWGMDNCNPSLPLFIVEGEIDALTLDEAGIPNVVSVPSGASDLTCVDECWEWLEQFQWITIWPDADEAGEDMLRRLVKRLGAWRCSVVRVPYKDPNDMLRAQGKEAIIEAAASAQDIPMQGLVRLADVEAFDPKSTPRVLSGVRGLDKAVGGFLLGQTTIWTGTNGSGKSTLLGQVLLNAIDQGYAVCAYSGELPPALFRYWIDLQAAGPDFVDDYPDLATDRAIYRVRATILPAIREWYRDAFFLLDSFGAVDADRLFEAFEYAARRYDVRVFLIDNLMSMLTSDDDGRYYRQQSQFVGRCVDFAHAMDCHVHIVAHPRKTSGRVTKLDVAGSGDITNRADNVLGVHRITDVDRKDLSAELQHCDNLLEVFKSRFTGRQNIEIGLLFDQRSRRFYMPSDPDGPRFRYSWARVAPVREQSA